LIGFVSDSAGGHCHQRAYRLMSLLLLNERLQVFKPPAYGAIIFRDRAGKFFGFDLAMNR